MSPAVRKKDTSSPSTRHLGSLFDTPEKPDLTIRCGDKAWKVHTLIVCTQCEFFAGAVRSGMKEATTGTIDLENDNPAVVEAMLRFLYTCDYTTAEQGQQAYSFHFRVYDIADKYLIAPLQDLVEIKLNNLVQDSWSAIGFSKALSDYWTGKSGSKEGLREFIAETIYQHARELIRSKSTREILKSSLGIGFDLMQRHEDLYLWHAVCPKCELDWYWSIGVISDDSEATLRCPKEDCTWTGYANELGKMQFY